MKKTIALFLCAGCCSGVAMAHTIFFGCDDNLTGTVPMVNHPNHDSAKAQFLAAAGTVGTQDFESIDNGPISGQVSFGSVTDALWISGTGSGISEAGVRSTPEYDAFAFSGSKYFMTLVDSGQVSASITFGKAIRSIGFSFSDEADWIGVANNPGHVIDLGYGEKISLTQGIDTSKVHSGSSFFIGIIADQPFGSMTLSYPSNGVGSGLNADAVGIDDMMVGVVPEPASVACLGFGAVVLMLKSRRTTR